MSRRLKEVEPIPELRVVGVVEHIINQQSGWDGDAVLLASINGKLRRVKVKFDQAQRGAVFAAGEAKLFVEVTGELQTRGSRLNLLNPRDFIVLDNEEHTSEEA
jgi:hypothetical protein